MTKPAARLGDMHICPIVTPGTPPVPHVGGPIMPPCYPPVLIGNQPAARVGDMCTCVGPPDRIIQGSTGVFIGNMPAARVGDMTSHGGVIVMGMPTVLIGEIGGGGLKAMLMAMLLSPLSSLLARFGFRATLPTEFELSVKGDGKFEKKLIEPKEYNKGFFASDKDNPGWKSKVQFEVGVANESSMEWRKLGDDDHIRVGVVEKSVLLGVKGDLSGEFHAGTFTSLKVAAVTAKAEGKALGGLVRGEVKGEALSASADLALGARKTAEFTGVEMSAGAEAVLAQVSAEGSVNISPATVYSNTVGRLVRRVTKDPEGGRLKHRLWDHGVRLGGKAEAGYGAAAKAGARLGFTDGAWGLKWGAKFGFGPMAGLNAFIGVF